MSKILVAMSGGVDSSVTAYLLKKHGNECIGCTMKLYDSDDLIRNETDLKIASEDNTCANCKDSKTCCSADDVADARNVANNIGIDFYVLNYKNDFDKYVIQNFVESYQKGLTPNPCIECNKHLKFGKLIDKALSLGCDKIATGHYAQIELINGKYKLKKALDLSKDQSYVLYNLTQEQLSRIEFPLGGLSKSDARNIAESQGFINARKHDSQDICFVPDGDYAGMIERYTGKSFEPGDFVDMDGNILGRHNGIIHYTIGQRRGLNISAASRLYVIKIDVQNNKVILGSDDDLYDTKVNIKDFHWIDGDDYPSEFICKAKIRYRMTEQPATVKVNPDKTATIIFDSPQRAATPGQTAVFYHGDYVLGGGIITN